ncbi:MAG: PAS domain S-box protein [Bacteroidota bacterium]|nr:PAS domain S-box protein [Bacteroidota bacterium]
MKKQSITVNLLEFDVYIGGLHQDDSILFIASSDSDTKPVVIKLVADFIKNGYRIIHIHHLKKYFELDISKNKVNTFDLSEFPIGKIKKAFGRFLTKMNGKYFLLLDSLSGLQKDIKNEEDIVFLYNSFIQEAKKKNIPLLATLGRSFFSIESIAKIKDSASVVLDVCKHQNELYFNLINSKERYLPLRMSPLKFDLKSDKFSSHEAELSVEPMGDFIPSTFTPKDIFQNSFRNASDAMMVFEWGGNFREVNSKLIEIMGYSADELKILNLFEILAPGYKYAALKFYKSLKNRKIQSLNTIVRKKNNKLLPVEITFSNLHDGYFLAIIRDRSQQIALENELRYDNLKYQRILEESNLAVAVYEKENCFYFNSQFKKMFGNESDEVWQDSKLKDIFTQNNLKTVRQIIKKSETTNAAVTAELKLAKSDSTVFECEVAFTPIQIANKKLIQIGFFDITLHKNIVEELQISEQKFKNFFESSPIPLAVVRDNVFRFCNQAFMNLFLFNTLEQVIGKEKTLIGIKLEEPETKKQKRGKKNIVNSFTFNALKADGTVFNAEMVSSAITYNGEIALLEFYQDITQRVAVGNDLKLRTREFKLLDSILDDVHTTLEIESISEKTLKTITEHLNWNIAGFYIKDEKNDFTLSSHKGMSENLLALMNKFNSEEGIGGFISKTQEPKIISMDSYPSYLPHSSTFTKEKISTVCFIPLISDYKVNGFILLASRKPLELDTYSLNLLRSLCGHIGSAVANAISYNNLMQIKDRYENLIGSISDVLYFGTGNEMFLYISPNIENFIGYKPKDYARNKTLWLSTIHPDDKKIIFLRNANLNDYKDSVGIEYRVLPKGKAEYVWIHDSITISKNDAGEIESVYGILSNINERKNLEEILRKTEQFKSGILSGIREGVVVLDSNFNFIEWNEAMVNITGLTRIDILGKNINELSSNYFGYDIEKYLKLAIEGQVVSSDDIPYKITETQKEGYLWGRYAPLESNDGNIVGVVAIITDITRRKKLEEDIKNSEQLLRNVIDTMGDLFVLTDLRGRVLQVNKEFTNALGFTKSEAAGKEFPYPWLLDEEMNRFVIWISSLRSKNYLHDFDMTWQTNNGEKIPISLNTTLLRNAYGEPIAMLNLARNISERYRMALELADRNKQIEAINQIIQTANQTMDYEKIFQVFANKVYEIILYDRIETCLLNDNQVITLGEIVKPAGVFSSGSIKDLNSSISKIALHSKKPIVSFDVNVDERFIIHNVVETEYNSLISAPFLSKGEILGTINLYSQEVNAFSENVLDRIKPFVEQIGAIIDRILLFRKVSDDAAYIYNLLNSIDKVIFTVDTDLRINEVNKAWFDFITKVRGESKKSYTGAFLLDEIPDNIFTDEYVQLSKRILDGSLKYVNKEFEFKTDSERYNYYLTIHPMIIGGRITGAVFTQTDITDLKRTEEELKKRNDQLLDLNVISANISSSFNLETIFNTALPHIIRFNKADYILLYLADVQNNFLTLRKQIGLPESFNNLPLKIEGLPFGNIGNRTHLFINNDVKYDSRVSEIIKNYLKDIQVSALAEISLKSGDKTVGIIQIFFKEPYEFTTQETQLFSLIGNQLGTSIENALLYSELQSQFERLNILYELSQHLTATLDIDQVLNNVYEQLAKIIDFEEFFIHLIDESRMAQSTVMHIATVAGDKIYFPKINQQISIKVGSPVWKVITSKQSLSEINEKGEILTYIPMVSKNNVTGLLSLKSKTHTYSDTELRLLENVCSLTAMAIEKSKLYDETVQKSLEIQRRNRELDDFTYVVSHDLKEPLISIEGYSQILNEEYKSILQGDPAEFLHSIVQASSRMKNLIDDLLMLSRIGRVSESFKEVKLSSVIDDVEIDLLYAIQSKGVKIIKPNFLPEVFGNATQLKIVFRNLLSNAIKFLNTDLPEVEIGCSDYNDDKYLCFVKDNGIGIEEKYFEKIFVIFQRLHSKEEYEGTGAGLAIVKIIIEMHRCKIWVESKIGKGTTFYFTLPKVLNQ